MNDFILSTLINNIPHAIFWKDKNFVFRGCNQQFAKQFGYDSPKQVIGKTDYDFPFPTHLIQQYHQDEKHIMETGIAKINYEEIQMQPDHSEKIVSVSKVPFYDSNNDIIGVLGIYTDITQRKEEEKQLRKAKEQAEISKYIMTEFISNMGHDLATPIADVGYVAQMLNFYANDYPELDELFKDLEARAEACNKVRQTIINATSIANLNVKPERFSTIHELLALEMKFRPIAEAKKLKFIIYPLKPKKDDQIETDRSKFYDILADLVSNAINFTEQGQITISVLKQDNSFHIRITDTGIGIPEDKFDYIFEQYTKLSRSNTHGATFKGVGAGLYLARIRANILGATISVESEVNKGSTFTLSIPVIRS